jgi:hypothetical protein
MSAREPTNETFVPVRLQRLNAIASGTATGLVVGLGLLLATDWLVLKGGPVVGPHLALRAQFFPGYAVRFPGNLVGFAYGFASGLLVSYLLSRTYNGIAGWQDRRGEFSLAPLMQQPIEMTRYSARQRALHPLPWTTRYTSAPFSERRDQIEEELSG